MAAPSEKRWWDEWAPYWERLEDRHFGVRAMGEVRQYVVGPVLVVGAGHGLLVSHLQERGLEVVGVDASEPMIEMARQRRGVELVHADARALPYEDGDFCTVLVASGVVDHSPDSVAAGLLREAARVVAPQGNLLIGFYRFPPQLERVYQALGGLIDGEYHLGRLFEIGEFLADEPLKAVPRIVEWTGRSRWRTVLSLVKIGFTRPRILREEERNLREIYKLAGDHRELIAHDPGAVPYRGEAEIRRLLSAAGLTGVETIHTDDCIVARHPRPAARERVAKE